MNEKTKKLISQSVKESHQLNKNRRVRMINRKTGEISYAANGSEAARMLGCTKQFVYQVLSVKERFLSFKSAKGHLLEWAENEEVSDEQA